MRAAASVLLLFAGSCSGTDEPYEADALGAFSICENFVKDRLKSPATAKFRNYFEDDGEVAVTGTGDGPYVVTSTVDSQNGFGAMLRSTFVCEVTHTGEGNWHLEDIALAEGG